MSDGPIKINLNIDSERSERRERIATAVLASILSGRDIYHHACESYVSSAIYIADELIRQLDGGDKDETT